MGHRKRRPPKGCVHHSDRGSQYAADRYRKKLAEHDLKGSMGRRGNPYDNAKAESFMKTLKVEAVYRMDYESFADVADDLPRFIDLGKLRPPLTLGRVTKARILQAVREARGEETAERIAHLKKGEMAEQAEELLAGSGWLPEKLRTPGQVFAATTPDAEAEPQADPEQAVPDELNDADLPVEHWQIAAE